MTNFALQGMDQEGRCTVEKGIESNRGERGRTTLRAKAKVVSTERNGRICRIAEMRRLHDLTMEAECSLKLR